MKSLYKVVLFALCVFLGVTILPQTRIVTHKETMAIFHRLASGNNDPLWYIDSLSNIDFGNDTVEATAACVAVKAIPENLDRLYSRVKENPSRVDIKALYVRNLGLRIRLPKRAVQLRAEDAKKEDINAHRFIEVAGEGRRMEPENAFWPMIEAIGHLFIGDEQAALSEWTDASKCQKYNDHAKEQGDFVVNQLHKKGIYSGELDAGAYASILLPHLSSFRAVAKRVGYATSESALTNATIGKLLYEGGDMIITMLVGNEMILQGAKPSDNGKPTIELASKQDHDTSTKLFTWALSTQPKFSEKMHEIVDTMDFGGIQKATYLSYSLPVLLLGIVVCGIIGFLSKRKKENSVLPWTFAWCAVPTWAWQTEYIKLEWVTYTVLTALGALLLHVLIHKASFLKRYELAAVIAAPMVLTAFTANFVPVISTIVLALIVWPLRTHPISIRNPFLQSVTILLIVGVIVCIIGTVAYGDRQDLLSPILIGLIAVIPLAWLVAHPGWDWAGTGPAIAVSILTCLYVASVFVETRNQQTYRGWVKQMLHEADDLRKHLGAPN